MDRVTEYEHDGYTIRLKPGRHLVLWDVLQNGVKLAGAGANTEEEAKRHAEACIRRREAE